MKLWVGHYRGRQDDWFLAWGDTKLEAAAHISEEWAEPELRSMRAVEGPGGFSFSVEVAQGEDEEFPLLLTAPDGDPIDASLGANAGIDENEAWIIERVRVPLPPAPPIASVAELYSRQEEPLVLATVEDEVIEPECDCIIDAEVVNDPCPDYVEGGGAAGRCLLCEHEAACHPLLGVRA